MRVGTARSVCSVCFTAGSTARFASAHTDCSLTAVEEEAESASSCGSAPATIWRGGCNHRARVRVRVRVRARAIGLEQLRRRASLVDQLRVTWVGLGLGLGLG